MRTEPTKQTETKIYTRKGDLGQTSLFGGEKVFKDDLRVQTYGTLDELQANLGLARALTHDESGRSIILEIQQNISIACAELASNRLAYRVLSGGWGPRTPRSSRALSTNIRNCMVSRTASSSRGDRPTVLRSMWPAPYAEEASA